ncbi:MAG: hypothetical protein CMD39_02005 [Gammaproteobacteria bacterium]|jgi:hypothetical protein|nr:hypothetical protein [Gammaproteobacteria bacterium]|tara:strand:- start:865 stop:1065 length:201 start_codon:yes stop_codon:yes gene_type:complete
MRYLVQLLIPALIFAGVLYALTRQRRGGARSESAAGDSDTGAFLVILVVSGAVALGTAWLMLELLG